MRLLDLFCGAGGCSVGYHRAGFDVTGVDIEPHDDYPFALIVADALEVLADEAFLSEFDVVHASPPCPLFSAITGTFHDRTRHDDLLAPARAALRAWAGVYVIENVPRAPLLNPVMLCGAAFGLGAYCRDGLWRPLQRHRLFESNVWLMSPGCACGGRQPIGVYGHGGGMRARGYMGYADEKRAALGIDWMRRQDDVNDAIPPAYTQHIGEQLMAHLTAEASA